MDRGRVKLLFDYLEIGFSRFFLADNTPGFLAIDESSMAHEMNRLGKYEFRFDQIKIYWRL